jgi:hypothetical protein
MASVRVCLRRHDAASTVRLIPLRLKKFHARLNAGASDRISASHALNQKRHRQVPVPFLLSPRTLVSAAQLLR